MGRFNSHRLCQLAVAIIFMQVLIMISVAYKWTLPIKDIQVDKQDSSSTRKPRKGYNSTGEPKDRYPDKLEEIIARVKVKPVPKSKAKLLDPESETLILKLQQENQRLIDSIEAHCRANKSTITKSYMNYANFKGIQEWVWMVFQSHDLFYCAVPKCGSTTWKSYLMEDAGLDWEGLDTHVAARIVGAKVHIDVSRKRPLDWLFNLTYAHKMMIVRSPWGRIASAYEDKILRKKEGLQAFCRNTKKYANISNEDVTFPKFVDCFLSKSPDGFNDPHTHPQSDLCAVCHLKYNLIVRLEDLALNERFLMKTLNFNSMPDYVPPQRVKSLYTYAKYYRGLDVKLMKRLKLEFKNDFELFGYPDSPFV